MGARSFSGGVGFVFGSVFGVLIQGVIQTIISFDGSLNSWWTRIFIGILLFVFIAMQRFLSSGRMVRFLSGLQNKDQRKRNLANFYRISPLSFIRGFSLNL